MNQAATAGLAGITPAYLSMIERGLRTVTRRHTLEGIANALRVSPAELTGTQYPTLDDDGAAATRSAMAVLGDLLGGWTLGEIPDGPTRDVDQLITDVEAFHAMRHSPTGPGAGDYPTQVGQLADLIRELLVAATDTRDRHRVLAPLLTCYHVAGSISARLRIPGMPMLAADRIRQVAEQLDDPVWMAVADWSRAHFLSGASRTRQRTLAQQVAERADAGRAETRGMAHLTAALASAALDDGDTAEEHLAAAARHAEELEPDTSAWPAGTMQFGRANVIIWRVSIGVELGHGPRVAEVAAGFRPETISRGRQADLQMDLGRGLLADRAKRDAGIAALMRAEQLAPSQVRHNVWAREAVAGLLSSARREAGGRDLRGLAWRMGIAPTG